MSGAFREGEIDPTGHARCYTPWQECRCANVGKGECRCDDDGQVTHGGVYREGFEAGVYTDGAWVTAGFGLRSHK